MSNALQTTTTTGPLGCTQVKFRGDRRWWDVVVESDRFSVLTRQAPFQPKGELWYTIIDRERGVRGPCNLIGQGFGDGTYDADQCAQILAGLELHVARDRWLEEHRDEPDGEHFETITEPYRGRRITWPAVLDPDDVEPIEVSYRNNLPVRIEAQR